MTDRLCGRLLHSYDQGKTWIEEEAVIWEPQTPVLKNNKMADVFAFLKFGQPSAILLKKGDLLMSHWICEEGCYKTCATRIQL